MGTNEDWEKKREKYPKRLTRAKAIKLYCKEECCAGEIDCWKNCAFTNCFLWYFRLGREISKKCFGVKSNSSKK